MSVLIGGGTGFIGRHLQKCLRAKGHPVTLVSRNPQKDAITWTDLARFGLPEGVEAVVNLSGENLMNPSRRWDESFKQTVISSRVDTTKQLAEAIANAKHHPKVWISTSAIGYYPLSETVKYTEDSVIAATETDFFRKCCVKAEEAAVLPDTVAAQVRQVTVRVGVVLGRDGGVIQNMFLPFFFGVGGTIGSGRQWFPWVHVDDVAGIYTHAVENSSVTGALNAVAPQSATNSEFTKAFARAMWRPAVIPVPASVLEFVFGPERASIMTRGQKVLPERTLESGYKFLYPDLESACKDCSRLVAISVTS